MRISMILLALAIACSGEKKGKDEPGAGTGSATTTGKTTPDAAPSLDVPANSGLAAKDNDPAVVALAKAAITCKVDGNRLDYFCPGYKAWGDSALLKENKADKTLVSFLEDSDEKVRFLGADKLDGLHRGYGDDPAAVKRVLTAAQRETSKLVGEALGKALGRVDLKKAGIVDAAKKLVADHPLVELRLGLISAGQHANSDELYDAVLAQTTSKDDKIRFGAIQAFWVGTPSAKTADVCTMWLEHADDTVAEIAGESSYMCGLKSGCKAQWDPLLAKLEGKARDGKVVHTQMASALEWLYKQTDATAAQKTKAIAVAKLIVENPKNASGARVRALDVIGNVDKDAKAYAAKLKDDPDASLKSAAERILKK